MTRQKANQVKKETKKLKSWKEIPIGGLILEPGSAAKYKTGGWRVSKPVHDAGKCIHCLFCWLYCPDSAIIVKDGKVVGIDYDHCKGCGICWKECPTKPDKAMNMVKNQSH